MVLSEIFFDMAVKKLHMENNTTDHVSIGVHPKNISNMRGLKNTNVQKLMHMFDIKTLDIVPDPAMHHDDCAVALLGS
jgi:flagellar biosynthesis/type III secretory pathway protein FliH